MKKLLALVFFIFMLCFCQSAAAAERPVINDEWTVLIYMCGSDLESKYSCGTGNLEEISRISDPADTFLSITNTYGIKGFTMPQPGRVNILIETGGAKAWHAQSLGMDIRSDALQIWHFFPGGSNMPGFFSLEAEKPLASMADPKTLSEFIRWGAETYPAKKYCLVLWSHGGGSATGVFIDELFNNEYMTLDRLRQAFSDGGVRFETVLFDACMMANIETACAIQDYANWMVASEELVAGKGTAIGEWLEQLICVPSVDGRLLGRWICDTAMIKYGNSDDRQAMELLTWSLIELSVIKRLVYNFDEFFRYACMMYEQYPAMLIHYASAVFTSETYGIGHESMVDLGGMFYQPMFRSSTDIKMQQDMQEALADAVEYCVRGSGRPAARGLSFCYATSFQTKELEIYSRNCPSVYYLALLDAISPWTAPEWVYDNITKMPELLDKSLSHVTVEKRIWENGSPAFVVTEGDMFISTVQYNLYRRDPATGQVLRLGEVPVYYDPDANIYRVYDLTSWPAIDGNLCQIELQNKILDRKYNILYNIPLMMDMQMMNMRCIYWFDLAEYEVFGLWEGYDNDSSQFNRNVKSLSQVAGREFTLMYEVKGDQRKSKTYVPSPTMIMLRSIKLEEITLPPGTYYIEFAIYDVFMRSMRMEMVEYLWDGKRITIQGDSWEGTEILDSTAYYTSGN